MLRLTETRLPETREITVYNSLHEAKVARLAKVTFSNGTIAYIGWHDLATLRRQFLNVFKTRQELPGMEDVYEDQVRAVFCWETFWLKSSGDEEQWLAKRLPDRRMPDTTEAEPNPPLLQ